MHRGSLFLQAAHRDDLPQTVRRRLSFVKKEEEEKRKMRKSRRTGGRRGEEGERKTTLKV